MKNLQKNGSRSPVRQFIPTWASGGVPHWLPGGSQPASAAARVDQLAQFFRQIASELYRPSRLIALPDHAEPDNAEADQRQRERKQEAVFEHAVRKMAQVASDAKAAKHGEHA